MAFLSPLSHLSKRESGVTNVSSNAAIASVTESMVILSEPNTCLKRVRYSGMDRSTSVANSCENAISPGFAMGPPACSFKSLARPSQNWARLMLEFNTVGELIGPSCQLCPMEVCRLSVPPILRLWQELQEINPDLDRRG